MNTDGQMSPRQSDSQSRRTLVVGLVNNASGGALQSTERRFARLLHNADPHIEVRLRLFRFTELPNARGEQGDAAEQYADLRELFQTPLDALIVTGMEPRRPALEDEPIWASITKLARWAEDQAIPTIWSCLAAHAAVLHLDGIARSQLPEKLSGVFRCDVTATDHALMQGMPCQLTSPHSRFFGLRGDQLLGADYQILSRSDEAGVDIFFKRRAAPFVFFPRAPRVRPGHAVARVSSGCPAVSCRHASRTARAARALFRSGNRSGAVRAGPARVQGSQPGVLKQLIRRIERCFACRRMALFREAALRELARLCRQSER